MQRDRATRFEQLPVNRTQDPDDIVAARGTAHNSRVLVDGFEKLANDEGNTLDSFHFFLGAQEFAFEIAGFVLDVVFLEFEQFEVGGELREFEKEVFIRGQGRVESGRIMYCSREGRVLGSEIRSRGGRKWRRNKVSELDWDKMGGKGRTSRSISMPKSCMLAELNGFNESKARIGGW